MKAEASDPYDVVIMGAGIAGLCQARHLLLKVPGLRIAIVDPKGEEETERDLKVGESLVEISAMFLYRELELQDYLIENHPPKYGLDFHWPKNPERTATTDDYFHVWTNGNPDLPSYQLNRARFEADLLRMNREDGVKFIRGRVVDTRIRPGAEPNEATVRTAAETFTLTADHLIDASGRKFLLGKKLDNLVFDKEELAGIDTGSAWLRVTGLERSIFQERRDPLNGSASHWYGTNHWFGHGHWIWMIPIETSTRTLSIGVVHHREVIDGRSLSTRAKFLAFLEANHRVLYDLVSSGDIVDFKYLPRIAHHSKRMLSEDRWYVIGEAANMFDPFYSTALVLAAQNIDGVTEVIRAHTAGESDAEEKRELYDAFIMRASEVYCQVFRDHHKHLGDACAMSWRIYMEMIFWFGILVPAFTGKWHLERDFIAQYFRLTSFFFFGKDSFVRAYYDELTKAQESGKNIGMMDYTRADQLARGFKPTRLWDSFRENTKYGRRELNVYAGIKASLFYLALLYARLRVKRAGALGLLDYRALWQIGRLLGWSAYTAMGELQFKWNRRRAKPSLAEERAHEFLSTYRHEARLMPWDTPAPATRENTGDGTREEETARTATPIEKSVSEIATR